MVAFGRAGARSADELLRDAGTLAAALPAPEPGRALLVVGRQDAYHFAAALLACWARGHTPLLSAAQDRATLEALLARDDVQGMVHDTVADAPTRVATVLAGPPAEPLGEVRLGDVLLTLTGEPPARLSLPDLALEPCAGRVVSALPPTHRDGLVHGLLRPLLGGGAFLRDRVDDAAGLTEAIAAWSPDEVVCAPTQLRGAPTTTLRLTPVSDETLPLECAPDAALLEVGGARLVIAEGDASEAEVAAEVVARHGAPAPVVRVRRRVPRTPWGAVDRRAVLRAFGRAEDARPLADEVELVDGGPTDEGHRIEVRIPDDLRWFDGHFPGYPVLSGVAQLDRLVLPGLALIRPELTELRKLTGLKFTKRILPGDRVELLFTWLGDTEASFSVRRGETVCAAGRLSFEATG